jgi:hypothetical protein
VGRDPATVAVFVTDKLGHRRRRRLRPAAGGVRRCRTGPGAAAPGEEALTSGLLPEDLTENFYEVVNIMASVFNEPGAPHLKLYKVHAVGEKLPTDVASSLGYVIRRLDLEVTVHGYGSGRLSSVSIG